jgi:hypothetical protein
VIRTENPGDALARKPDAEPYRAAARAQLKNPKSAGVFNVFSIQDLSHLQPCHTGVDEAATRN